MQKLLKAFVRDERGVSAMEYAILAGIVVLALVAASTSFSSSLSALWTGLGSVMSAHTPS